MKKTTIIIATVISILQWACTDKCEQTRKYKQYTPITVSLADIRQSIKAEPARNLENPGKIYTIGKYLFINEIKQGIHIIDNSNPSAPRTVSFLKIPGNGDMAVRGNILYADSYSELVALNIADPLNIKEVGRVSGVFQSGQFDGAWWYYNAGNDVINDNRIDIITETIKTNCEDGNNSVSPWGWQTFASVADTKSAAPTSANPSSGQGGSMARFALYDNFLYTVGQSNLQLFNIKNAEKPVKASNINFGWGIETIFPYKDKLFIGSTTGMFIFDNSNPEKPTQISVFQHAMSCDPVVVEGDRAYVTLRSGNTCNRGLNQLDVVDIADLRNPKLLKSYPMQNPHGLGVSLPNLFVCEGKYGLKSLDATNDFDIKEIEHLTNIDAYDVIPLNNKVLLMIGKDGFYQFDYSNPKQLKQLSKIPVNRIDI
jgi:hypothetical protein